MKRLFCAALATLFVLAVMPAAAAPLYSQAPLALPNLGTSWTSTIDNTGSGFIAWDNFTLSSNSTITSVRWRGFAWDFVNPANNPVPLQTLNWGISFFDDVAGAPANSLFADVVPTSSLYTVFVGAGVFNGDTVPVYDFTYTLSTPLALSGGTQYWFTPISFQSSFNPIFSWSASATGDNLTFQCSYSAGSVTGCQDQPGDRAFSLYGTSAAPEPSSLALLGTGFAALVGVVRRRLM